MTHALTADFRVVCALAGPFLGHELPESDAIFIADGGLAHLLRVTQDGQCLSPCDPRIWQWIGDGDSLPFSLESTRVRLAEAGIALSCRSLPADKDLSDFGAALDDIFALWRKSASEKRLRIYVLGGLGGRRDHALCNLMEAADVCERARALGPTASAQVNFQDGAAQPAEWVAQKLVPQKDHTALAVFTGEGVLHAPPGKGFSLVRLRGDTQARIAGAIYSGVYDFTRGSRGLSNALTSSARLVRVDTQGVFVLALSEPDSVG